MLPSESLSVRPIGAGSKGRRGASETGGVGWAGGTTGAGGRTTGAGGATTGAMAGVTGKDVCVGKGGGGGFVVDCKSGGGMGG